MNTVERKEQTDSQAGTRCSDGVGPFAATFLLVLCLTAPVVASAQDSVSRTHPNVAPASAQAGPSGLSPTAQAALDRAVASLQANELADAERSGREAVQAAPGSAIAHNVLGVVLDRAGRKDEALAHFNAAIKLDPKFVGAHNNLGRFLAERGKSAEAIAEFEQALKIDAGHVQAHFNLGVLYGEAGEYGKATDHLARARAALPNDTPLALAFLNVAFRANRNSEAEAAADMVERNAGGDPRTMFTLGSALAQNKQYERAVRVFIRVNEALPRTYEVLYNLGIALYNLDRNDEAARYLAEAADLNPAPAETHFRLGLIASARSDRANAVEEFKHATERDQKNANYHYLLGREYFRAGFWEGAVNEFSRAMEIEPTHAAYVLARADANYRRGEWAASTDDFDRAASLDPGIESIEYWQGYAHRAAGNFDLARQYLEKFLLKNPDHVDALGSLGYVAIEQGRLEDADGPLRRALSLDPRNSAVLYDYARLAVKRRDYPEAVVRLQRVIEKNPAMAQAQYQLFLAYTRLKQPEQAQSALAEFKRLDLLEKQTTQERILDEKLRTQQMLGQQPQ